ncbi:MAG: hypothetical protein O6939_12865, partial [Bacteroidetes bacterium]|nr:hypothetical protein [Bacteroidota bacterium]
MKRNKIYNHKMISLSFHTIYRSLILYFILLVSTEINAQEKVINFKNDDSVVAVSGGSEYAASKFKRFWLGDHYRESWTEKISVPYLNLNTTYNGLTAYKIGGGRQTTSLRFKTQDGREYVFRSVNKDPRKAIDFELRESVIGDVIKDQTSTQHPYGAIVVSDLLDNTDILHARPKLYVLPDDPALGSFRADLANLHGMLEERTIPGPDKIVSTEKVLHELQEKPTQTIDYKNFAKARMFDILIGDWSKHEDNWKWGQYDLETGKFFKPIPRDRDHAFSRWDGVLP